MTTGDADSGAMRVTLRDVYQLVLETHAGVTEIKQTVALQQLAVQAHEHTVSDHETRLRAVERRVWQLPSIATIVAVLGTVLSVVSVVHSYAH